MLEEAVGVLVKTMRLAIEAVRVHVDSNIGPEKSDF